MDERRGQPSTRPIDTIRELAISRFFRGHPVELTKEIASAFRRRGAEYRLSAARFRRLRQFSPADVDLSLTTIRHGSDGERYYDRTISTIPYMAIWRPETLSLIENIGHLISILIDRMPSAFPTLGLRPSQLERTAEWPDRNLVKYVPPSTWVRIDFLFQGPGQTWPVVIDINLNPGMTFINEAIFACFRDHVAPISFDGGACTLNFDATDLRQAMARGAARKGSLLGGVLVRENHGLYPDMLLFCKSLNLSGIGARIILPSDVDDVSKNGVKSGGLYYNSVARVFRKDSKFSRDHHRSAEDILFGSLREAAVAGWIDVIPTFCLALENHIWPWVWRSPLNRSFLTDAIGDQGTDNLLEALPPTAVIVEGDLHWDTGDKVPLSSDALRDTVVKAGGSTGGKDVFVLRNSSQLQRNEVLSWIHKNQERAVIQRLIRPRKEPFPVYQNGEYVLKDSIHQYSSYFFRGSLIGTHALVCPDSYKCHGGSRSFHVPVAIMNPVSDRVM